VKLTTHLYLVPRPRMVELYTSTPQNVHDVLLNLLSTGTTLPFKFTSFFLEYFALLSSYYSWGSRNQRTLTRYKWIYYWHTRICKISSRKHKVISAISLLSRPQTAGMTIVPWEFRFHSLWRRQCLMATDLENIYFKH
jgi:hypothetical protein